jgi:DNA polymerase II small subunit/DNA polymerase delta subunit B
MDDLNAPVTKGDIQGAVQGAVEQLRSEMHQQYDDLKETIRDSETKLLKAFYSFAESNQQRLAQVEGTTNGVIARLVTLETRILEVEKRLNMPPAA